MNGTVGPLGGMQELGQCCRDTPRSDKEVVISLDLG